MLCKKINIDEPILPRQRRAPGRLDDGAPPHQFTSTADFYWPLYFEVFYIALQALDKRFKSDTLNRIARAESLLTNGIPHADNGSVLNEIISFYGNDIHAERLRLHINMLHDIIQQRQLHIGCLQDIVKLIKTDQAISETLTELHKFVLLLLTVPISTCTPERSFSALRYLKTYLRTTMSQERLNHCAIMHIHRDIVTEAVDIESIANDFISRSSLRMNTFS